MRRNLFKNPEEKFGRSYEKRLLRGKKGRGRATARKKKGVRFFTQRTTVRWKALSPLSEKDSAPRKSVSHLTQTKLLLSMHRDKEGSSRERDGNAGKEKVPAVTESSGEGVFTARGLQLTSKGKHKRAPQPSGELNEEGFKKGRIP